MINIEKYVDSLVKNMNVSGKEKKEYKLQFFDHIYSLKEDYMAKGHPEDEAQNLAIKDFGNEKQIFETGEYGKELNRNTRLILSSFFFIYCFILFGHYIKLAGSEGNGGSLAVLNSLIPIKTIIGIIHGLTIYGFDNWYIDLLVTYIVSFIPIGVLIPLIFTGFKSLRQNLKLFILLALGIQIVKLIFLHKFINIDFALMNVLGCFIGFTFYRLIKQRLINFH